MFKHLGLSLMVMRELKGVSQAELARKAGVGKSQLSKYENGKELPKLDSLQKVLEALEADSLAFFYLEHFLGSIGSGQAEPLLATNLWPLVTDTEQQAFTLLIQGIFRLFKAQMAARVAGTAQTGPGPSRKGRGRADRGAALSGRDARE